ncbi:MAG TPA: hypothetical protein VF403_00920, partial [Kofleriaceae bacterium]
MRRGIAVVVLVAIQLAPPSAYSDDALPVPESAPTVPPPETFTPAAPPPTLVVEPATPLDAPTDHKVAAAATMAGLYTLFGGWMYLAWYRQHKPLSQYKWGGDDEPCSHTLSRCGL